MDLRERAPTNIADWERLASATIGTFLLWSGIRRRGGWTSAAAGSALISRAVTGHSSVYAAQGRRRVPRRPIRVVETFQVNVAPLSAYEAWRNLHDLPRFMHHLESVSTDGPTSHWVARFTGLPRLSWDAEIIRDEPARAISWRSIPGSQVENAGSVVFTDLGGRGTGLRVELAYRAPAGPVGASVARALSMVTEQQIREDVRHFKQLMETGEIPRTEGQPTGAASSDDVAQPPAEAVS